MLTVENHLISRLPRKDRVRLQAVCDPVDLIRGELLCEPDQPIRHVYFPTEGFLSLIAMIDGSPGVEVGMVGREGMLGAQLALGESTLPFRAVVQGPGAAWCVAAAVFRRELAHSASLRRGVHRYLAVLMVQQATSATCLRFHRIGPRLARWLLMSQDRAQSDNFYATQEFLAHMLGVRREGITMAAGDLQRCDLVGYHRGHLTILDRSGLEAAACGCYVADEIAYARLLK